MLTRLLPYGSVYTAERVAYRNYAMGLLPPRTATCMNPYCEWIGAQIRADAYGYICPGQPAQAAGMAWRDAMTSHVKNGIYGAMWTAAALLHGGHDLSCVMCIAVMGGLDTDCNGATAGSIAGVMCGEAALAPRWITPFNDVLHTSLLYNAQLTISEVIARTCALAQSPV
jgi:hypothetical protein